MDFSAKEPVIIKTHLIIENVVDGDGLILANSLNGSKEEIRLLGIDAPEIKHCNKLIQDERETHIAGAFLKNLGRFSFNYLLQIAPPGTRVTIALEQDFPKDMYGRTLAYVFLPAGQCLNKTMVQNGYAKPYDRFYCQELAHYQRLSNAAKRAKKGLFALTSAF